MENEEPTPSTPGVRGLTAPKLTQGITSGKRGPYQVRSTPRLLSLLEHLTTDQIAKKSHESLTMRDSCILELRRRGFTHGMITVKLELEKPYEAKNVLQRYNLAQQRAGNTRRL